MSENTPRMALGTMHFGTRLPADRSREILDAYLDLGGLWIDTANCYAFWSSETGLGGQSETVIGQWLTDRGVRDRVRLSTKVGAEPTRPRGFLDAVEGLGKDTVHRAIRDSL
ncbi:putative aldo-keto reductase [Actinomyces viscosus]|uniref:Putative aldo-keto reductase n=1 Tax=Actinomyces viscosus TaxID=1656 RepID=A0A3S4VWR3_ACTVI|nr:putative aldo-keto reductase [Actinomyces viscosus]